MNRHDAPSYRIGLIVPSSNTTLETEFPALLRRQEGVTAHRFTFHSARLRLRQLTPEALRAMNESAGEAVDALCDAQVDAVVYACLVATMAGGRDAMRSIGHRLAQRAAAGLAVAPPVVTSAAALVSGLQALGARRVAMIAPYRRDLTDRVAATLAEHGIEVGDRRSLEVTDNVAVGRLDQGKLLAIADGLDTAGCDAVVLSACLQMPSLDVLHAAEQRLGLPVVSAASASVRALLDALRIVPDIDLAGVLLRPRSIELQKEAA